MKQLAIQRKRDSQQYIVAGITHDTSGALQRGLLSSVEYCVDRRLPLTGPLS